MHEIAPRSKSTVIHNFNCQVPTFGEMLSDRGGRNAFRAALLSGHMRLFPISSPYANADEPMEDLPE